MENNNIGDLVKAEYFYFNNTGSVAAGTTVTFSKQITVPSGYKALGIIPQYSGDDGFCWVSVQLNSNSDGLYASGMIRNVTSAADSGTPTATLLFIRNL